ncbi:MAG: NAD+ synthase [Chloroflexi bacterium]|nr:NAD+ synthase [Chloroflexota bacterium]
MRSLRLGMAQVNSTVGDFQGNTRKILAAIGEAKAMGVDLLAFPELCVCGYPPEDLLFKPQFIDENTRRLREIAKACIGLTVVIGFVDSREDIYNAAAVIHDGNVADVYHKVYLPNYGVFDEDRYFRSGKAYPVYTVNGVGIGVNICEDIWYEAGPATAQAYSGAQVIVNISASPYHYGKRESRERMLATRAADNAAIVAYCNLIGGQDELVFDGDSVALDEKGQVIARGKQFEEDLIVVDLDIEAVVRHRLHDPRWRKGQLVDNGNMHASRVVVSEAPSPTPKPMLPRRDVQPRGFPAEVYAALVMGTRDYVTKNGFKQVIIGLSGGIDSSLVAAIAVDALLAKNVVGVSMPSRYSSPGSKTDAAKLAENLGIKLLTVPIEPAFQAFLDMLEPAFKGKQVDVTEENIQARVRGIILMALSNKFGYLVLTTGNKSEMATGFTTLYGDMAGGFAVIKDVPKTMAYKLAAYRNTLGEVIPPAILTKEPSPELKAGQKTVQTLPPYPDLDPVLVAYVEDDRSVEQIAATGVDEEMVKKVARMVDRSEYKRRQAPPGIKITPRAFGRDRRLPITNRFKEW